MYAFRFVAWMTHISAIIVFNLVDDAVKKKLDPRQDPESMIAGSFSLPREEVKKLWYYIGREVSYNFPIGYSVIVALTGLPIGYSVIVALTGLPIGYSVIVALTGLPIGYSVIVALTGLPILSIIYNMYIINST